MDVPNIVGYSAIGFGLLGVYLIERRDWECLNSYQLYEKCKPGEGMAYRGSTPSSTDPPNVLLEKINKAAMSEYNSIKWRRALVISAGMVVIVFALFCTPGRLPKWYVFLGALLACFGVMYFIFNYYSFHRFMVPANNIKKCTEYLSKFL